MSNFYRQINITRVFAILFLLCYASVVETCIAVLTVLPVTIDRVSGNRWGRDPNAVYGVGLHGVLVVISVILLVVLIPLPIILLIPRISFYTEI